MDYRVWKKALFQWVCTCEFVATDRVDCLENTDLDGFFHVFQTHLLPVNSVNADQRQSVINFIKTNYQHFELRLEADDKIYIDDYVYIYSMLLHYACIQSPTPYIHQACQQLPDHTQKVIANMLNVLLNLKDSLTRDTWRQLFLVTGDRFPEDANGTSDVLETIKSDVDVAGAGSDRSPNSVNGSVYITEPQSSTDAAFNSPTMNGVGAAAVALRLEVINGTPVRQVGGSQRITPETPKTSLLENQSRELHKLRAQVETEIYEKSILETQLKQSESVRLKISKDNKRLQAYVKELKDQNADLIECAADGQSSSKIDEQIRNYSRQIKEKDRDLNDMADKVREMTEENSRFEDRLKKSLDKINLCYAQISELENKKAILTAELKDKNNVIAYLQNSNAELEKFVNESRLDKDQPDLNVSTDFLNSSLLLHNTSIGNVSPENLGCSVIDKQLREKEQENAVLRAQIQTLNENKQSLARQMSALAKEQAQEYLIEVECCNSMEQTLEDAINALKFVNIKLQERIFQLEKDSETLNTKYDAEKADFTQSLSSMKHKLDLVNAELLEARERASANLEASMQFVTKLELQVEKLRVENEALQINLDHNATCHSDEIKTLKAQLDDAKQEALDLADKYEKLMNKHEKVDAHVNEISNHLSAKDQEINKLGNEIGQLHAKNKQLEQNINLSEDKIKQMSKELEDKAQQYDNLFSAHEQLGQCEVHLNSLLDALHATSWKAAIERVGALHANQENFENELGTQRTQISELSRQLQAAEDSQNVQKTQYERQLEDAANVLQTTRANVNELEERLESTKRRYIGFNEEIKRKLQEKEDELRSLRDRSNFDMQEKFHAEMAESRAALARYASDLKKALDDHEVERLKNITLSMELNTSKIEVVNSHKKLNELQAQYTASINKLKTVIQQKGVGLLSAAELEESNEPDLSFIVFIVRSTLDKLQQAKAQSNELKSQLDANQSELQSKCVENAELRTQIDAYVGKLETESEISTKKILDLENTIQEVSSSMATLGKENQRNIEELQRIDAYIHSLIQSINELPNIPFRFDNNDDAPETKHFNELLHLTSGLTKHVRELEQQRLDAESVRREECDKNAELIRDYEAQISYKTTNIEELENQLASKCSRLEHVNKTLKSVEDENEKLKSESSEWQTACNNANATLEALKNELAEKEKNILTHVNVEFEHLRQNNAKLEESIKLEQEKMENLKIKLQEKEVKFEFLIKENELHEQTCNELKNMLKQADSEQQNLQKNLSELQSSLSEAQQQNAKIHEQNELQAQKTNELQESLTDLQHTNAKLHEKIISKKQKLNELHHSLTESKDNNAKLLELSDLQAQKLNELQLTLSEAQKNEEKQIELYQDALNESQKLREELTTQEKQLQDVQNCLAEAEQKIESKETLLTENEATILDLRDQVTKLEIKCNEEVKRMEEISSELEIMCQAKLTAEGSIQSLEAASKQLKEQVEMLTQAKLSAENDVQKLTMELEKLTQVKMSADNVVQSLTTERKQLNAEHNETLLQLEKLNQLKLSADNDIQSLNTKFNKLNEDYNNTLLQLKNLSDESKQLIIEKDEANKKIQKDAQHFQAMNIKLEAFEKEQIKVELEIELIQKQSNKYRGELNELRDALKSMRQRNETINRKLETTSIKLGETQALVSQLKREKTSLTNANNELETEKRALSDRLDNLGRSNETLNSRLFDVEKSSAADKIKLENAQKNIESLKAVITTRDNEIEKHKEKVAELTKEEKNLNERLQVLMPMKSTYPELKKELDEIRKEAKHTELENSQLRLEIGSLNAEMQQKDAKMQQFISQHETEIATLKANATELQMQHEQNLDKLEKHERDLLETKLKKEKIEAELDEHMHKIVEYKNEIDVKTGEIENRKEAQNKQNIEMSKLREDFTLKCENYETELRRMRSTLNANNLQNEKLKQENLQLTNKLEQISSANVIANNDNKETTEIQELQKKISAINAAHQEVQLENKYLKVENKELDAKYKESLKLVQIEKEKGEERIKEQRLELEGKLEKMKNKMKVLYTEEIAKMRGKQEREVSGIKAEIEMLQTQNKKYEEHTRKLSTQIVRLNDKILEHQKQNTLLSTKLKHMEDSYETASLTSLRQFKRPSSIHVSTVSCAKAAPAAAAVNLGTNLAMEDEEGEIFNNTYLTDLKTGRMSEITTEELQYRNSLLPPHLKSAYAATYDIDALEDDIKDGPHSLDDSMSALLSTTNGGVTRKKTSGTHYKRPGPPTPSKHGGRLSFGGSSEPAREILKETYDNCASGSASVKTPARFNFFTSRFSIGSTSAGGGGGGSSASGSGGSSGAVTNGCSSGNQSNHFKDEQQQKPFKKCNNNLLRHLHHRNVPAAVQRIAREAKSAAFCTSTPRKSRTYYDHRRRISYCQASSATTTPPTTSPVALKKQQLRPNDVSSIENNEHTPQISGHSMLCRKLIQAKSERLSLTKQRQHCPLFLPSSNNSRTRTASISKSKKYSPQIFRIMHVNAASTPSTSSGGGINKHDYDGDYIAAGVTKAKQQQQQRRRRHRRIMLTRPSLNVHGNICRMKKKHIKTKTLEQLRNNNKTNTQRTEFYDQFRPLNNLNTTTSTTDDNNASNVIEETAAAAAGALMLTLNNNNATYDLKNNNYSYYNLNRRHFNDDKATTKTRFDTTMVLKQQQMDTNCNSLVLAATFNVATDDADCDENRYAWPEQLMEQQQNNVKQFEQMFTKVNNSCWLYDISEQFKQLHKTDGDGDWEEINNSNDSQYSNNNSSSGGRGVAACANIAPKFFEKLCKETASHAPFALKLLHYDDHKKIKEKEEVADYSEITQQIDNDENNELRFSSSNDVDIQPYFELQDQQQQQQQELSSSLSNCQLLVEQLDEELEPEQQQQQQLDEPELSNNNTNQTKYISALSVSSMPSHTIYPQRNVFNRSLPRTGIVQIKSNTKSNSNRSCTADRFVNVSNAYIQDLSNHTITAIDLFRMWHQMNLTARFIVGFAAFAFAVMCIYIFSIIFHA